MLSTILITCFSSVSAGETSVRPILFDLGFLSLKDRPTVGDDIDPVRAGELLGDQDYMAVAIGDQKFQLARSKKSGQITINGLEGCHEIYFYSDSIGCQLEAEFGHRPNLMHLNYKLEALVGADEREILDERMIICQEEVKPELNQDEESIFEDVYFIKMDLASLKGEGLSDKTGLYIEEDRITERERVLDSFTKFWSKEMSEKFEVFERFKLRESLNSHQFETSYLGCPVAFSFDDQKGCTLERATALEIDREAFSCKELTLFGGKLWCDSVALDFRSSCPLGALIGRSLAGAIPHASTETQVFDGARGEGKSEETENSSFTGSRSPGKVISK